MNDECEFKIGDKVIIVQNPVGDYPNDMKVCCKDDLVGMRGTVTGIFVDEKQPYKVEYHHSVHGPNYWYFPGCFLKAAEQPQQHFNSGAVRDTNNNKLRYDLIPPSSLARLAKRYTDGAEHYGEHNWTRGIPSSRHLESLMRHLEQARNGEVGEDHWAAVAWNCFAIMYNEDCLVDMCDLGEYPWNEGEW